MICPHCGTHIDDGALRCPACRAELGATVSMGRLEGTFCPACGALVPEGADACAACGMPLPQEGMVDPGATAVTERVVAVADEARIESALPPGGGADEDVATGEPGEAPARRFLFAVFLGICLVGGGAVLITHPWDPLALDTRATEEADTSLAGFPGTLDALSGQDSDPDAMFEVQTTGELVAGLLDEAADELERLHGELAKSDASLRAGSVPPDEGLSDAEGLAAELSNLIAGLADAEATGAGMGEERDALVEQASYLRNWADALVGAWGLWADDPEAGPAAAQELLASVDEGGRNAFRLLYEEATRS